MFIDDNEPTTYNWELTKATAVAHANNTYLAPAELVVRRTGSTLTDERQIIRVTSGGAMNNGIDLAWGGDFEKWDAPYLPALNSEVRVLFASRRSEARIQVNKNTATWVPVNPATFLQIYVTNLFSTNYQTIFFHQVDRLFTANFLTNQIAEGGSAVTLRLSRPDLGPWGPIWPSFNLVLQVNGVALAGADHTLTNLTNNIPGNLDTVDIPVQAISDGLSEGWESVFVRLDPMNPDYSPDTRAGQNWVASANVRDPGVTGTPAPLDNDGDGMTDDFERANGTNPFVFDDPYMDSDGDGIPDLEESLAGTNPNSQDSDNDGLDDYTEWTHGSNATNATENFLRPASDYASVKLAAASCYRCHETTLQVGPSALTSARPVRGQYAGDTRREQIFQFLKGASYPIHIGGPVLADAGGSYTAEILPPTNGVPPEFFLNDPDGMLGVAQPVSNLLSKTATLIVPKVELTWTNKGDNLALDDNTNAINGEVRGQRIFVGAKTPTDSNLRNTVMLKIKTAPPLIGSNVWVRSFDVDDTTDDKRFDNAGVIDTTGRLGEDNFNDYLNTPQPGLFVANGSSSYATTLDANGEAWVEFRVEMQPGNNYRVAATVFPTSQLGGLQSGDATGGGYVSGYTDVIRSGFNGALSPLLTVWRKLHLEIDSMTAVPTSGPQANFVGEKVVLIKTNAPNNGQTTVYFRISNLPWQTGYYTNGTLTIAGTNYTIVGQGANPSLVFDAYHNYVIVAGAVPPGAIGAACELRDDDERWVSQLGLPTLPMDGFSQQIVNGLTPSLSSKPVPGVASTYLPAFIDVVDANQSGWNPRRTIPFFRNKDVFDNPFTLSGIFDDAKDLTDSPVFWVHTVTIGFQPETSKDGDPNSEEQLLGVTAEHPLTSTAFGYSAIYNEAIVEHAIEYFGLGASSAEKQHLYYLWLLGNAAHETGHAPGKNGETSDHNEKGLMEKGGDPISGIHSFKPVSILRFRKSSSWTGGTP